MGTLMKSFQLSQRRLNAYAASTRAYMIASLFLIGIAGVMSVDCAVAADAASIKAAVVSGKPLSDIIRKSLAESMKMKDIIAALNASKVPADSIVYTSITEKLSECAIVKEAIQVGGDLPQIITAAKAAGCSDSAITNAAKSAGADPDIIAKNISDTPLGYRPPRPEPKKKGGAPNPTTGGHPGHHGHGDGGCGHGHHDHDASPSKPGHNGGYK